MEIHLLITVHSEDKEIALNYSKIYHSATAPSVGSRIKDSLFAESKNIIDVTFDYSEDKCLVTLEPRVDTKERLMDHIQEVAAMHHWVKLNN